MTSPKSTISITRYEPPYHAPNLPGKSMGNKEISLLQANNVTKYKAIVSLFETSAFDS